jgi:hypothetical protein
MNIPMKEFFLASIIAFTTLRVLAQGTIQFQNRNTAIGINCPVYLLTVGYALADGTDTGLRVALMGGPTGTEAAFIPFSRTNQGGIIPRLGGLSMLASPSTGATWTTFRTGAAAGYVGVGTDSARALPGIDYGGNLAEVQVVAWRGNYNTWAEAYAAYVTGSLDVLIGASNPLIVSTPASATDLNLTWLVGLESFALIENIPEPSPFALVGLGAAAMMIFRRWRK